MLRERVNNILPLLLFLNEKEKHKNQIKLKFDYLENKLKPAHAPAMGSREEKKGKK